MLAEVVANFRVIFGSRHPESLHAIYNYGVLLHKRAGRDDLAAAVKLYAEAAEGARATLGEHHPHTRTFSEALSMVSMVHEKLGDQTHKQDSHLWSVHRYQGTPEQA